MSMITTLLTPVSFSKNWHIKIFENLKTIFFENLKKFQEKKRWGLAYSEYTIYGNLGISQRMFQNKSEESRLFHKTFIILGKRVLSTQVKWLRFIFRTNTSIFLNIEQLHHEF